jgi:hypothetical protein
MNICRSSVSAVALADVGGEDMICAGLHLALAACGPSKAVNERRAVGARWRRAHTKGTAATFAVSIKAQSGGGFQLAQPHMFGLELGVACEHHLGDDGSRLTSAVPGLGAARSTRAGRAKNGQRRLANFYVAFALRCVA